MTFPLSECCGDYKHAPYDFCQLCPIMGRGGQRVSAPEPPKVISIRWCPVCGRDDRAQPFTGKSHFARGERCGGQPVRVEYHVQQRSDQNASGDCGERCA